MEISQTDDSRKGSFQAIENGEIAGKMTYSWAGPDKFIIDHTEVEPAFSGQGVGKKLVLEAVRFAREKQVKILPLCPYAKHELGKSTEFEDVLF